MQVELWRVKRVLVRAISASNIRHHERGALLLSIEGALGEISPQPTTLWGDPGIDEVTGGVLELLGVLRERIRGEGELPHWTRLAGWSNGTGASRMATALVEMCLLEHDCRENSRVQTDVFAPCYDTPELETVSLDDVVWPEIGTSRVRLKTSGEWRGEHREALSAFANDVILDFNGAPLSTPEILATARAIAAQCSIHHLEQATAPGDWLASQQLREISEFQIGIDEGLRHMGDLQACLRYRAASVICIKPPRVGGLAVAHDIFRRATSEGMTAYLGGFFDGPLARSWHRSLARATTAEASDIGPVDFAGPTGLVSDAGRWVLDDDISAYGELIFRGEFL